LADPIEITNVGGEGVASEVTLANLLAVTEQMAKKAGIDPKDVNKKLSNLAKSTEDTIKVSSKNRDALKDHTKSVKASSVAMKAMAQSANGIVKGFGAIARSGTEMAKAFLDGQVALTSFAQHIPVIGGTLSVLTGVIDNTFSAFQNVAMSGAAFNNSLTELRDSAAQSRLSLDEFTSFVGANSYKLAQLGGTATQGAKNISAMVKALGTQREDLLNMGLTFQDINEAMLEYEYITRSGNRGRRLEGAALAAQTEAAADYAKHLQVLAKLAGDEAKSQQEAIAQQMADVAFQRKLATMDEAERIKINETMKLAMATGGQDAVDALKAQFLGMPPLTEGARLYTATMQNQMNILQTSLQSATDESVSAAEHNNKILTSQVDMMEANSKSAAQYETLLNAAASGLDGDAATIAGFFNNSSAKFTDYINKTTGEFDRAAALRDAAAAQAEANNKDKTTAGVTSFLDAMKSVQETFQTSIVTPLMDSVGPAFKDIAALIAPQYDANGDAIEGTGLFSNAVSQLGTYVTEKLAPEIEKFLLLFKDDPMKTLELYFEKAMDGLGNLLKDMFLGKMNDETGEREGGLLAAAGEALKEGFSNMLSENGLVVAALVAGATLLFSAGGALSKAMVAGAGAAFSAAGRAMSGRARGGSGATVGRDPRTGRFTSLNNAPKGGSRLGNAAKMIGRGAKYIPGVGWALAGGMGIYDSIRGFNADPDAGFLESAGNAGSSLLNGLTFGLLGESADEIAARSGASNGPPIGSGAINNPSLSSNIEQLNSLDADSVRQYTSAMEQLVEVLGDLNDELSPTQNSRGRGRTTTNAGSVLSGSGLGMGSEQLNTTMQNIYILLQEMRDLDIKVERNTSRINGGNVANGGVSAVER